jgi:homoserine O-acetyltransferase
VTDFVTTGTVDTSSPVATDHLINGLTATASAAPVPESPPGSSPTVGLNK